MKRIILICTILIIAFANALAQTDPITVTGVVTDTNKEPLIGVTVTVEGVPGLGVITDLEGKYSIKLDKYHRLVFTYIGYDKQVVLIKDQTYVNIVMQESLSNVLDNVVVTATGPQKSIAVTGAITSVNVDDLKNTPSSSITNSLAGNVPGIIAMQPSGQPGAQYSEFWIRGISTFGANQSAYVLVDGFERSLNDINIEDIATFTVLKDASATAIYGSKGANGVILITTKHGKSGKINIDAKIEGSYNTRTITPQFVDGSTYASLANEAAITRNMPPIYTSEQLQILRLGLDPDLYPNVNWQKLLLRPGAMSTRANLNISGGGETARYYISMAYNDDKGMYRTDETLRKQYNTNDDYRLWNYRMNADLDITKTTHLAVGVGGTLSTQNTPGLGSGQVWNEIFGYNPTLTPVMYSNGYAPAYGIGVQTNPWVSATQTGYAQNWANTVQINVELNQDLSFVTQGLKFIGRVGYDINNSNSISRKKWPEQWLATGRDSEGNILWNHVSDPSDLFQESSSNGSKTESVDLSLTWDRTFGQHHLGAILKYRQDSQDYTQNIGTDIKNGIAIRDQSLAGQVTYNWKLRYFINANFGYNGSENFANGHKYGFFPAVSVGWNIGEEPWIQKHFKWINMFKVRYSYGHVGNDNLGSNNRFPYLATISEGLGGYDWSDFGNNHNFQGMGYTQVASPYVTWEMSTKNDWGLDWALFDQRFTGTIDFFTEKRTNIYMVRNFLPQYVGLTSAPSANVGSVWNQGFDGNFAWKQKINQVTLTIRGNITYAKNKILEDDEQNTPYLYQLNEGYQVNQTRGLIALGLFKDWEDIRNSPKQQFSSYQPGDIKYKDVNGDGVINGSDAVAIGSTTVPNLVYGIGASVLWKGFDVNVLFQGAGQSSFLINGASVFAFSQGKWGTPIKGLMENRWIDSSISGDKTTENINATYPRLSYGGNSNNQQNSTYWMRDGKYIRLKNVEIGYTIPKVITTKLHLNNVRFYATGQNLFVWAPFKLWDPELNSSNGEVYPITKSITVGMTVNL